MPFIGKAEAQSGADRRQMESLSYAAGQRIDRRRPGTFDWRQTPGPRCVAPMAGVLADPLCLPCPALSSAWGGGALGALTEPTYRLYNCAHCGVQVRICARCDHGQICCAGPCARARRRESLRRAGARYQRTLRGALCHARRQRRWRARQREVTHQGYRGGACCASVSAAITAQAKTDALPATSVPINAASAPPAGHCSFCGAPLPAWTRLRGWPWSG